MRPGDLARLRDLEDLPNLHLAQALLSQVGLQEPAHGGLDVVDDVIDDVVGSNLDPIRLGDPFGVGVGPDVETDDDRVGGRGQHHVGLRDPPHAAVHDIYLAQLTAIYLFVGLLTNNEELLNELYKVPDYITEVLGDVDYIQDLSKRFNYAHDFFYLGRGYSYPTALEGALKLKEITYIHGEGYAAGELKLTRSEERRVGKECRSRWSPYH